MCSAFIILYIFNRVSLLCSEVSIMRGVRIVQCFILCNVQPDCEGWAGLSRLRFAQGWVSQKTLKGALCLKKLQKQAAPVLKQAASALTSAPEVAPVAVEAATPPAARTRATTSTAEPVETARPRPVALH